MHLVTAYLPFQALQASLGEKVLQEPIPSGFGPSNSTLTTGTAARSLRKNHACAQYEVSGVKVPLTAKLSILSFKVEDSKHIHLNICTVHQTNQNKLLKCNTNKNISGKKHIHQYYNIGD